MSAEREHEPRFSNYEIRAFALEGIRFGEGASESVTHEKRVSELMALRDRIEAKWWGDSLEGVWHDSVPWSEKTFPQATAQSIASHILSEAKELVKNPYDPAEAADIALLLGHLQYNLKITIALEAARKFAINKERKWGPVNNEGFVEHVRDEPKPGYNYMKMGPDGRPYGIGNTNEQEEPKGEERPTIEVDAKWYETCVETSNGELTGRTGKVLFYKIGSRTFAKPPVWDSEPSASTV
jgi:hypothetical protein